MGFRKRNAKRSDNRSSAKVIMGKPASQLSKEEKKILSARMAEIRSENGGKNTVQNTIPFLCMYQDGVCQVSENFFSLTVQFYDANYSIAEFDEQNNIFSKEKKIFSKQEIEKMWQHSDDKRIQTILFMIYTGLRIGEFVALKKSDIHLEAGYLVGGEKTEAGRNRVVPIPQNIPELSQFLSSWISDAKQDKLFMISSKQFRNKYFYSSLIEIGIIQATEKNGRIEFAGEHHTPHSTRHTFASISAAAGVRPENLQKIIGHSDFATTADIYVHQDIDTLKQEMTKIKK